MYATAGFFISSRDMYDGMLVMKTSKQRAEELIRAARHDKRVMKWLERIANGSDVGSAIFGHVMMFYAIMAHHNRIAGNPVLLAHLGYHEAQVLASTQGQNGSDPLASQQFQPV
jgi:hypothetical protein